MPLVGDALNVLTTVWKWEVDSRCLQVCVATAVVPPALEDVDSEDGRDPVEPPPLVDPGTKYVALGSSGYANDTQVVAVGVAAHQGLVLNTEEWLWVTG